MNMSKQTKPKRPVYNLEFKQDAAKLVIKKEYTHQQAADSLAHVRSFFSQYPLNYQF